MEYEPPPGDEVELLFGDGYGAPIGDDVVLLFGEGGQLYMYFLAV